MTSYEPLTDGQLAVLAGVGFVRLVPDALRPLVCRLFRPLRLGPGAVAVAESTAPDALFVVSDGELEVVRRTAEGEVALDRLGVGRVFGEVALLEDRLRIATVRAPAARGAEVLRLAADAFYAVLEVEPAVRGALAAGVRWSRVNSLLRGHPAFSALPLDVLVASLDDFEPVELPAGTELPDAGDGVHVVETGRVVLTTADGQLGAGGTGATGMGVTGTDAAGEALAELGPGDFFGESVVLDDDPVVPRVRAAVDSRLFRLDRARFARLMARDEAFATAIRRRAAERDARLASGAGPEVGGAPVTRSAQRLLIEIDQSRRERAVAEIVESDFFAALQARAEELRRHVRGAS